MVYSYTPVYYTSIQDSITSLCKNILPFSFKKKRLPAIAAAEQMLSKQQADNLKWQQESFHQILKLMGLCKEDLITETEVSDFRTYLLDTLIASPHDHEHAEIIRDKLVFLQELLYSKCISEVEYHSSKRPLLQRLAVQGDKIEARDLTMESQKRSSNEEWSVIDLKDDKYWLSKESSNVKNKCKQGSTSVKGVASVLGFTSSQKNGKFKEDDYVVEPGCENSESIRKQVGFSTENPFWNTQLRDKEDETKSILMQESLPLETKKVEKQSGGDKPKRKPFKTLFQKDKKERQGKGADEVVTGFGAEENVKLGKKQWGFDGFMKWKKNDSDDEEAPLASNEKSHTPAGKGLDPCGAPSDFFVDKALGKNIKKELAHIQAELRAKNTNNHHPSNEQIEVISTSLPVDKDDKSWCDQHGDRVVEVMRKGFKGHVGEMVTTATKKGGGTNRWTTFDEDNEENSQPNTCATNGNPFTASRDGRLNSSAVSSSTEKGMKYNPFFDV